VSIVYEVLRRKKKIKGKSDDKIRNNKKKKSIKKRNQISNK